MSTISTLSLDSDAVYDLPDWDTDPRLLPTSFRRTDNSRRVRHYKRAVKIAIKKCLTETQRQQLKMFYWQGLNKSEIAARQGKGCSAVTKSLRASENAIREFVEMYLDIYDKVEQEWLRVE